MVFQVARRDQRRCICKIQSKLQTFRGKLSYNKCQCVCKIPKDLLTTVIANECTVTTRLVQYSSHRTETERFLCGSTCSITCISQSGGWCHGRGASSPDQVHETAALRIPIASTLGVKEN